MLRPAHPLRRWRTPAAVLAALLAAPAAAVSSASAAHADGVRQQEQWVLNALDVAGAWQHTRGSGVTVALIDSGVNGQVSDLAGSVTTGRDFSGVNTPSTNANWGVHGTWMASLIAGHGHPPAGTSGITGVAPAAKILSIRAVTDQRDPGYRRYQHESESRVQQHLADAIKYATSKRVSVISMSLGYQGASLSVRAAISAALARGIVVVASSGNSGAAASGQHGNAPYSFPANYLGVLGVGAVSQSGQPAGFSSDNLSVQVAAPGVRVPAQGRDDQYWLVSGTSPACALTAGVAALIKSVYPALAPALVVQAITATTSNKPHGGYDEQVGFGTVDATAALKMAGRLARDHGTGRGLVAVKQFGGGQAAVPAVPVAPRGKRQLLVDSLTALAFLVVVLVMVFRLIVTRRPAVVGAPGGRAPGAGASPAWGTGPGASPGWARGPGAPAAPGAPAGPGGSGADATWPGAGEAGYGRSTGYRAPGGYKPPAGPRPSTGYGFQQPADPAPPAGYRARGYRPPSHRAPGHRAPGHRDPGHRDPGYGAPGHGSPASFGAPRESLPGGNGRDAGYPPRSTSPQPPASAEPPTGAGLPAGAGPPASLGPPASGGPPPASLEPPPAGNGSGPAGYRPLAGYQPFSGLPGSPAGPGGSRLRGVPDGSGFPGSRFPDGPGFPGSRFPDGPGFPGSRFPDGPGFPAAPDGPAVPGSPGVPGLPGAAEAPGSASADVDTGPLAGYREATGSQGPPGRPAGDVSAADDDTWPSSGPW